MNDVKEIIRQFVLVTHLPGESAKNLRDDTPLQASGILDSLGALGLVSFVEERFGISLDLAETTVDRFDRIEEIATAVMRKQADQAQTV